MTIRQELTMHHQMLLLNYNGYSVPQKLTMTKSAFRARETATSEQHWCDPEMSINNKKLIHFINSGT